MELDRRSFLRTAAATGIAAGAMGVTAAAADGATGNSQAPVYVGHTWENPPAPIAADQIAETYDCEILIIGAGVSGLAAAEAAASNGADVIICEQWGTFSARGADNCAIGTKLQEEWGKSFDKEKIVRDLYQWGMQSVNIDLVRTFVYRSAEVFDHINDLAAAAGVTPVPGISVTSLKCGWDELPYPYTVYEAAHSYNTWYGGTGVTPGDGLAAQTQLATLLEDSAISNGAQFKYNHHAEQLIREEGGAVTGAVFINEDGEYVQVNASKGVILATGDMGGNVEMCECFSPITLLGGGGLPMLQNGEGHIMGMWVGAAHQNAPAAPIIHPTGPGTATMGPIMACWTIVDIYGNRRGSEMPLEPYITDMKMNAPKHTLWYLFDSNYEDAMRQQEPDTAERIIGMWDANVDEYLESGLVLKADTLEELAELMDVPAENLISTVERRNGYCYDGYDPEFEVPERFLSPCDTAPFYAAKVGAGNGTTMFGLHVNRDSQVLDTEDEVIPGLYAVGNVQGDFFAYNYPVMLPGISHGRAITFGSLVGAALANDTTISA